MFGKRYLHMLVHKSVRMGAGALREPPTRLPCDTLSCSKRGLFPLALFRSVSFGVLVDYDFCFLAKDVRIPLLCA